MTTYQITFNEKSTFGKNLLALFEQNKKLVKLEDPLMMSKEEFEAICNKGREEFERGECREYNSDEFKKRFGLD